MTPPIIEVFREFRLSAAHFLPKVPEGHKCRRLHGHNYRVIVKVRGRTGPDGMVEDFDYIKQAFEPVMEQLDHRCLNDIGDILEDPTAENLCIFVYATVTSQTQWHGNEVSEVTVWETDHCGATYRP